MALTGLCLSCCVRRRNNSRLYLFRRDEDGISMSSLPSTIATSLSQDVLAIVTRPVDEYKLRQIHAASVNGEKSLLQKLIAGNQLLIDAGDQFGRTALMFAVLVDRVDCAEWLLKNGSNIKTRDKAGRTALHWASYKGNYKCLKLLLNKRADWSDKDHEGQTALHLATRHKSPRCLALILKQLSAGEFDDQDNNKTEVDKCNVGALDNMFRTPLHWAAVLGYANIVKMLLHSGADHASSDANGATPLHYAAVLVLHAAALSGHASSVRLLLEVGADVNAADNMKHTAIFRACEIGNTDVVKALIEGGARLDGSDQDGRSPLHWATLGGHAYICLTLAAYAVDPDLRDHSGRSPLQCAAYGGFVNCMSVLIENQADLDLQDNEPTALDYALMGEHQEVAQYLIEQGGLSINAIQDIAVAKIQAVFRGYRVRKTFLKRKTLLMKHEKLRKDAAMKRAKEELQKKTQEQATGIFFDSLPTNERNKNQNNNNNEASAKIHRRLEGTDIALVVEGKSISKSESDETKTIEKSVGKSTKTPLKDAKHPALKQG
ncbi:PREDICTED: inversin-like [Priapulus caudatus]|uniref:Inversin-like n=1 Tax=Priapulus caudatus TaxID=37621 RepID=A0ABM1EGP6_PRICU|nr:PREDICTED: inversin-like [Priapulus caudatus]